MVDVTILGSVVWLLCGIVITYLGYLIGIRGRVELHAAYDESVDASYAARWAGGTALLMGGLVIAYAIIDMRYGFDPYRLGGLVVALLVLSYVSKLFARGFGAGGSVE
ncbi:hypothetical protein OB905_04245 [Halobacteria archaeon AArc-dxtr1]|nr:hypothetical protein [Halobacteria archaeon AArc-dxtr1]